MDEKQEKTGVTHRPATANHGAAGKSGHTQPAKKGKAGRIIGRSFAVLALVLFTALGLAFGAVTILSIGPFHTARDLFVVSVEETSAVKFLSRIYYSEEEVQAILASNAVLPPDEVTDVTKPFEEPAATDTEAPPIEVIDVSGSTFKGKLMIVQDPSRVKLVTLSEFGKDVKGKQIEKFAEESGATAAINGGWFDDPGGVGKGGMPLGLMMKDGVIVNGSTGMESTIVGFDKDNHLVVGKMTGKAALDMGIRDCVSLAEGIMPPLIINGKMAEFSGNGSGLNPRTAIGQRADGAVLLLVIDGRQPHSIGAMHQDSAKIMLDNGAINASALDGGSSSVMVYNGKTINICSSLYGSRAQPAAWIVE